MVANLGADYPGSTGDSFCVRMDKTISDRNGCKRSPNGPRPIRFLPRWNTFPLFRQRLSEDRVTPGRKNSLSYPLHLQRPQVWAGPPAVLPSHNSQRARQQMTVGNLQARNRPQPRMDATFFGDSFSSSHFDHTLTGDLGSFEVFASSPNSLYMYDLEKTDMQSSFGNNICGTSKQSLLLDPDQEFDLKDTYENSQDICSVLGDSQTSDVSSALTNPGLDDGQSWDDIKPLTSSVDQSTDDVFNVLDTSISQTGPTLAELNSEPYEDITVLTTPPKSCLRTPTTHTVTSSCESVNTWTLLTSDTSTKPTVSQKSTSLQSDWFTQQKHNQFSPQISTVTQPVANKLFTCHPRTITSNIKREIQDDASISNNSTIKNFLAKKIPSVSPTKPVLSQTGSQMHAGKRRSPQSTVSFDPALNEKWEEIRHLVFDEEEAPTKPKVKRESIDSVSSSVMDDSDSDISSEEDNCDSDTDSDGSQDNWTATKSSRDTRKKEKQYFWQYNIQSKGPKGTRMNFDLSPKNPHVLKDFEDPVFDTVTGSKIGLGTSIRHGGKARKGDGNDISPNPKKLVNIGTQLKKLNKQINNFAPLSDLPASTRNKSKKEKNKLASRACRLKKKAQHEAYKVKLHGLELEHKQLMTVMKAVRQSLREAVISSKENRKTSLAEELNQLIKENLTMMVAGHTTDFVNSVVKRVEEGDPTGGLGIGT